MTPARPECIVFGAGALGLGFLGPELAPQCRVTYVDIPARTDLLEHLQETGRYAVNITGLSMRPTEVEGVSGLASGPESQADVMLALEAADLVFTAVGEPNLRQLAPLLARACGCRTTERPLRVLCAENGVEVARNLRGAIEQEAGRSLGGVLLTGDTVMGRMCKVVARPRPPAAAVAPGVDWAVVAEPYFGIPVEEHTVEGLELLPAAIRPAAPAGFHAHEDVKMLAHNGLHATLGALGYLRGAHSFGELRSVPEIMEAGRHLLADEAAPALIGKHRGVLDRSECLNYCDWILRRVTCPVLDDSIERGVRGAMRKLEPWERLVYSMRAVAAQGIEPTVFATGVAAAVLVAQRSGATRMSFAAVLTEHCGLDTGAEADLIDLVERCRSTLEGH
jgi:mannitol-1-phosphate/altronate dehydrogenase